MIPFLKLIRWTNLLAMIASMIGVHAALFCLHDFKYIRFNYFDFSLLVCSTVLIAGAGNAINDYFDIRADRVNKPKRMVIGKTIKKRWAIVLHWLFNFISVLISLYLSIQYETWFYIFIHFFATTCLWTYSIYLKKIPLFGNVCIALLTALVPLLVVHFYKDLNESLLPFSSFHENTWGIDVKYGLIYLFGALCFLTNLSREIIKDIQDVEGDKLIGVRSIPIIYGKKRAGIIASIIATLNILLISAAYIIEFLPDHNTFNFLIMLSSLLALSTWIFTLVKPNPKIASQVLKLSLFIGIIALFSFCI